MTRLNIGARNAKDRQYDKGAAVAAVCTRLERSQVDSHLWDTFERQTGDALEWVATRSNDGDGINMGALERLDAAVCRKDGREAVRAAVDLLSGRMHATARDIVGGAAHTVIYNLCGRRAYTFEVGDR